MGYNRYIANKNGVLMRISWHISYNQPTICFVFPHIFVWGSCFLFCIPRRLHCRLRRRLRRRAASAAAFAASRTALSHTTWSHTIFHIRFCHTQLCCTLGDTTFHVRGRRGTCSHPHLFCVAGVSLVALGWLWWCAWGPLVAHDAAALCEAGVALGDIYRNFAWQAWQAWHLVTWT